MKISLIPFVLILLSGCITTARIGEHQPSPAIRIYAGLNNGGIIENTDMKIMDNVTPDAYTGATSTGFHRKLSRHSPIDYIF